MVWYAGFLYRAKSWDRARRVVAKVEWHNGELYPRVGFIVTNLIRPAKRVVRFYNQRGTAEQWIKEGKNAVKWTRLSCHDFVDNQVRLHLFVLAYNLGNFLRQAVLPRAVCRTTIKIFHNLALGLGIKPSIVWKHLLLSFKRKSNLNPCRKKKARNRPSNHCSATSGSHE